MVHRTLLILSFVVVYASVFATGELMCVEKEREALLRFKRDLIDEGGLLSSWGSEEDKRECCLWKGVECCNGTGHVIGLNLSRKDDSISLGGKVSSALHELSYLNHLDLSFNDFEYDEIPKFIGSLEKLHHLNLADSNFFGVVPHQLGNLAKLRTLDLWGNKLEIESLDWLSNLSSLSLLDLGGSCFKNISSLRDILKLPSLKKLHLSGCQFPTFFFDNSSSSSSSSPLSVLDLSNNGFTSSSFHWLFNINTSLRRIDLSTNNLNVIPDGIGRFTLLKHLDLSYNQLRGGIPKSFGNLNHLKTLDLSLNNLSEPLPELFHKLSEEAKESLEILSLDYNELYGSLPNFTLFSRLRILELQHNHLNGSFPDSFRHLSKLEVFDLSENQVTGSLPDLRPLVLLKELHLSGNKLIERLPTSVGQLSSMLEILDVSFNSFEGTLSDAHLSKLHKLKVLDLSFNSLALNFTIDWVPPFQLDSIRLASCDMGARFPTWLRTQTNFSQLDLSCAGISDGLPKWFTRDFCLGISYLNLSHNQISGRIPDLASKVVDHPIIDISYNNFSGHVPLFQPNSVVIQLSNNMFVGSISSICAITYGWLVVLDLSRNQLSGELPNCWDNMKQLVILNLANNKLSGYIPHTLGSLVQLQTLHLRDNNFFGELPSNLKNCKDLVMFDVGGNKLQGHIPTWIGVHLTHLRVLILWHNNFNGSIPLEICHLNEIQILDLSRNSLSGRIPQCFNNFTSVAQKNRTTKSTVLGFSSNDDFYSYEIMDFTDHAFVQWKGQLAEYRKMLRLLTFMDLSSNRLVGNLSREFSHLKALISLNLSRNYLSGNIISNIDQMEMLECLDLSRNKFSGKIPAGLGELHYLAVLDLSNNNLSGKIPVSTQLQGFDPSVYTGNNELCGSPLMSCHGDDPNPTTIDYGKRENNFDGEDDGFTAQFLSHESYISIVLGFIVGFWGVVGTLALKNSRRIAYFNFFNRIGDWLYVTTTVNVARLKRRLRANAQI